MGVRLGARGVGTRLGEGSGDRGSRLGVEGRVPDWEAMVGEQGGQIGGQGANGEVGGQMEVGG